MDNEGQPLPTLVYLAREKRPQYPHNFKAGAMNALVNSPYIVFYQAITYIVFGYCHKTKETQTGQ